MGGWRMGVGGGLSPHVFLLCECIIWFLKTKTPQKAKSRTCCIGSQAESGEGGGRFHVALYVSRCLSNGELPHSRSGV